MRRGLVIIKRGDPEICGALIESATAAQSERLSEDEIEVVEAEIDRQKIQRALLRVAVNNTKTNEDYDVMITKARGDYGERCWGGALRRIGTALLVVYAMAVYALAMAYRAQDAVLGRR